MATKGQQHHAIADRWLIPMPESSSSSSSSSSDDSNQNSKEQKAKTDKRVKSKSHRRSPLKVGKQRYLIYGALIVAGVFAFGLVVLWCIHAASLATTPMSV